MSGVLNRTEGLSERRVAYQIFGISRDLLMGGC